MTKLKPHWSDSILQVAREANRAKETKPSRKPTHEKTQR